MREDTITKFCISACIFMILVSLSMNLVVGLNIFKTEAPTPINPDDITTINDVSLESILTGNLDSLLTGAIIVSALVIANCIRTGSYTIIGPLIFTFVFWASWLGNIALLKSSGYFDSDAMGNIYRILMVGMIFLFVGAVAGMIGGND